jgi:deoxyhypusine synthase
MTRNDPKHQYLAGPRIQPRAIRAGMTVDALIDETFLAYNAGRIQTAARLLVEKGLHPDTTMGLSLAGAMSPAGVTLSTIIPLVQAGFIDWIVSTGANLYHDAHFGLGLALHRGSHTLDDRELFEAGVIRIYDVLFDYEVLLKTDAFIREVMKNPEFKRTMGTAEFHHLLGKHLAAREEALGLKDTCLLTVAYRCGVPCYVSSPGDSSIGMNVAEMAIRGEGPVIDVSRDVNETAAIVYDAKKRGRSAVLLLGGGSPKNFVLQTEPQIQEVLGLPEKGHDYFIQVTDARPDTGGLSGATPSEAVSWGKIDPSQLPDTVVIYSDTTIAAPLLAAYMLSRHEPRPLKRLYDRRDAMYARLREDFLAAQRNPEDIRGTRDEVRPGG